MPRAAAAAVCLLPLLLLMGCDKKADTPANGGGTTAKPADAQTAKPGDAKPTAEAAPQSPDQAAKSAASAAATKANLQKAFDTESAEAALYQAYATKADQEGLPQAARLCRGAAGSEQVLLKLLGAELTKSGQTAPSAAASTPVVKTTAENLKAALATDTLIAERDYSRYLQQVEGGSDNAAITAFKYAMSDHEVDAQLIRVVSDRLATAKTLDGRLFLCPTCGLLVTDADIATCPSCFTAFAKFTEVH